MELKISNKFLEVRLESFGAELIGLKDLVDGREYMWQKNPKFWAKCSPILFPFIGSLKDNQYLYKGKSYQITTRHGFARDYNFEINYQDDKSVEFLFGSNEETLKIYPFNFKLYLKYILDGKKLRMEYKVENLGDKRMYFSLGAHPAFAIPIDEKIDYSDYYIEFEKEETGDTRVLNGVLIDSKKVEKVFDGKKLVLAKDKFKNDAIIIENPNSYKVNLKNDKNKYNISFTYEGFRYIAFWNIVGAEYICLEPWCGISDFDNCNGNIEEKVGIETLETKEKFVKKIEIKIL